MDNLMNLVMQFRKVCNHPDLFEKRLAKVPISFSIMQVGMPFNPLMNTVPEMVAKNRNPI